MEAGLDAVRRNLKARFERERAARAARRSAAEAAVVEAVRRAVKDAPSVTRVYLFGSVIRENAFRDDSDVDVAVEGLGVPDHFPIWRAIELAAPGWTIDVRDITRPSEFAERDSRSPAPCHGPGNVVTGVGVWRAPHSAAGAMARPAATALRQRRALIPACRVAL